MSKKIWSLLAGAMMCVVLVHFPCEEVKAADNIVDGQHNAEISSEDSTTDLDSMINIISYPAYKIDAEGNVTRVVQPRTFNGSLSFLPGDTYYWPVPVNKGSNSFVVSWASNTTFNVRFADALFRTFHSVDVNNRSMYSGSFNFTGEEATYYIMVKNTSEFNKTLLGVYVNGY